jgi:phosphate transport system substrate-binding protein
MSASRLCLIGASIVLLPFAAPGCSTSTPAAPPIIIDGSSTVYPISEAVVADFRKKHSRQDIQVGLSSTGAGLKRFCANELDIADASRHINADEVAACSTAKVEFVELPIAYDAISVIVNRNNTWAATITVAELKRLWEPSAQGKVTRWSQVRDGWPDREIRLVGPNDESGTFNYFNEAITGGPTSSRKDYAAHVDDHNIVKTIESDELALGYVGFPYYMQEAERLKAVAIDDLDEMIGPGAIEPTFENVRRGVYAPLSRTLFIYVKASSLERPEVQQFVDFYARFATDIATRAGAIALRPRESELVRDRLQKRVLGTMFATPLKDDISLQRRLTQK